WHISCTRNIPHTGSPVRGRPAYGTSELLRTVASATACSCNSGRTWIRMVHVRQTGRMRALDNLDPKFRRLLDLPLYGHLGTIRADNTVQVNPMWFEFDGEHVRFTHTSKRQKFRNLQSNPSMSFSLTDPDEPTSYLEVRGKLVDVIPDPEGEFYIHLGERYGKPLGGKPADAAERVILVMSVERTTKQ